MLGQTKSSCKYLEQLAWLRADTSLRSHPDFAGIAHKKRFRKALERMERALVPLEKSTVLKGVDAPGLHAEGIAYDAQGKAFFIGGIHQSQIWHIDEASGAASLWSQAQEGRHAISGLFVHPTRRELWLCSNPLPEYSGYTEALEGQGSLQCYSLDSKALLASYPLPKAGRRMLGDIALHEPTQHIYGTDSYASCIYRAQQGTDTLEVWLEDSRWRSLQGLCFSPDGRYLFVADYANGLFRVDIASKTVLPLSYPEAFPKGIDGLYWHQNRLIGIHNGLRPFRVVAYGLNDAQDRIINHRILENNHSLFDEPTLGVIVGQALLFIADSPWGGYDKDKQLLPEYAKRRTHLLRLPLAP